MTVLALLGIPLVRYALIATAVIALVWLGINRAQTHWAHVRETIRDEVTEEVRVQQLESALKITTADRDAKVVELSALRTELRETTARVGQSRTIIQERIVQGELPNGTLSETKLATVAEIDRMEAERLEAEAND